MSFSRLPDFLFCFLLKDIFGAEETLKQAIGTESRSQAPTWKPRVTVNPSARRGVETGSSWSAAGQLAQPNGYAPDSETVSNTEEQ